MENDINKKPFDCKDELASGDFLFDFRNFYLGKFHIPCLENQEENL